ncbi:alpha/beta fold hydrolase [Halorientalis halophila]|uniref:alpha/beta fold hydrolase n=1 Tax=Halorientalis halophila TaxID=3108499 RepID=UPI00300A42D8
MTGERGDSRERGIERRGFLRSTGAATAALALGVGTATAQQSGSGITSTDRTIDSWDGTPLATTFFTPAESGPNPTVLMTHGWGSSRGNVAGDAERYAANGYNVLTYDSRGFGDSSGTVGLNGPKEVRDAQHLIDWLANRREVALDGPGNPRLGMDGRSYAGGIQLNLAAADDRVDALVPRIGWSDLVYSLAPNGVVKSGWIAALLGLGEVATWDLDPDSNVRPDAFDWFKEALKTNEQPPDAVEDGKKRSLLYNADEFATPTLQIQGWDDTLFKPIEATWADRLMQEKGVESRLAFYAGGHSLSAGGVAGTSGGYLDGLALDWLDRHVRGADTDVPRLTWYEKQSGEWGTSDAFPLPEAEPVTYDFGAATLSGTERLEKWSFFADTEATYTWTVDRDVEIAGTPRFDLTVDVGGETAHLFFELQHDGEKINVGEAYRVEGTGRHRIEFEFSTLQRYLSKGDELGLRIYISDLLYLDADEADGVTVDPAASQIKVPQRPR